MALNAYLNALQILLHDQAGLAYPQSVLTGFINEARQQAALESESIRGLGTIDTVPNQEAYRNDGVAAPTFPAGIANLITPRSIQYDPQLVLTSGRTPLVTLIKRNWDWFNFYELGMAARPPGPPRVWAPFVMGTPTLPQGGISSGPVASGTFYINQPNMVYTLQVDGTWGPLDLETDDDPEALPGPFNDAVPLYGLYLGFMDARLNELAQQALQVYELFMTRARGIVTPLPEQNAFPGGLSARRLPGMAPPQRGAGAGPPPAQGQGGQGGGG
jgi:hypothetical protein